MNSVANEQCGYFKDNSSYLAPANKTRSTLSFRHSFRVLDVQPAVARCCSGRE